MKCKDFMNIIQEETEFELFKGDRIGVFLVSDIGIEKYYEDRVICIYTNKDRLVICLEY